MYSLFIDTSYKYLTIVIDANNKIIDSYSEECFKKQSEMLFVVLDDMLKRNNINRTDIDSVYITDGPGSYTGVRISMTLAKVLCTTSNIKLFKISTLKLYSSRNKNALVIMDARAKRAYVGIYDEGKCILLDQVMPLENIDPTNYNVYLDGSLINLKDTNIDIVSAYIKSKDLFEEVKDIDHLTPKYLKESDSYYR